MQFNVRQKLLYYCIWLVMSSMFRCNHFLIFDWTVSFSEMRGLPLILVCGLFHPVTLSDMLEAMEGQLYLETSQEFFTPLYGKTKPLSKKSQSFKARHFQLPFRKLFCRIHMEA